jgi:aspartate/tyrosine/aromatic aminotransferase
MFERLEMAPPDAILGLTEAFKADPNPEKINLGVGVYKDGANKTPVLESVKRAEEALLRSQASKSYMPITGDPAYGVAVREMLFGANHEIVMNKRAVTAHTPGGTGALRVASDFLAKHYPGAAVWVSEPTWANHPAIFEAAGLTVKTYPYYDAASKGLDFEAMMSGLDAIPEGDVVLLHACCHNPSGIDPDAAQWAAIAALLRDRKLLPFIDFAYQGFADGLEKDTAGLRAFCAPGAEMLICSSFSKNFGLYCERTGALTVVTATEDAALKAFSQIEKSIRANYSNPPAHGAAIVTTILGDPELRALWEQELTEMRDRINGMRRLFVDTLKAKGVQQDFSFITHQKGMFSFSGLNKDQVARLKKEYAIYIVGSGRINVAGMTEDNMDRLCTAIASVL